MKKRYISLVFTVVFLVISAVLISDVSDKIAHKQNNTSQSPVEDIEEISDKPSAGRDISIAGQVRYMLIMDGDRLCICKDDDGDITLLRECEIKPLLMSDDEMKKLKEGIYSDSFEEICLYFESYAS
ncbi:MAG: hypothetical protein II998_07970 [Clostridia bacterium]|nr:hypothetical protein [Clostridia bacterium]